MSDLSPDTNKLLELARGAGALTDERRLQIKASLLSQIAAGGALTGAASHVALGKAAWLSSPLLKGLSALALCSVVGAGLYVGVLRAPSRAVVAMSGVSAASTNAAAGVASSDKEALTATAPTLNSPDVNGSSGIAPTGAGPNQPSAAPSAAAAPGPALVPTGSSSGRSTGGAGRAAAVSESTSDSSNEHAATPSADTLAGETSLLRDADQALRAGNAARALELLDEHAARYPHGVLAPERSAERVLARCKLGQLDAKGAQSYLGSHANSPFLARIVDACGVGLR